MTAHKTRARFTGQALLIGISTYPDRLALPPAVRNDAEEMAILLRDAQIGGYDPSRVEVLLDEAANAQAIRDAFERLVAKSRIDETTLIYFSGHGARRPAPGLLAHDLDDEGEHPTLIGRDELGGVLSRLMSDRIIVILDACHAGAAATLKDSLTDKTGIGVADLTALAQGAGRAILSSSTGEQPSVVLPGDANSLFTRHLLAGLRGAAFGDGPTIGVLDLYTYANAAVRRDRPTQTPVLKADLSHNIPLALRPDGGKLSDPSSPPATDLGALFPALYPLGPLDQHIWTRAGGDVSRLQLTGTGRTDWFAALRVLKLGGGGDLTLQTLLDAAQQDYPRHPALASLRTVAVSPATLA